jgi:hypothetical protein
LSNIVESKYAKAKVNLKYNQNFRKRLIAEDQKRKDRILIKNMNTDLTHRRCA